MTIEIAPAKLTWFLEITGFRENGYHELRSEMVTLDLCDQLEIDKNQDFLKVEGAGPEVPSDGTNLVARALSMVGRLAGVTVKKRIPTGGGLGGGSADAAAILRWAGGVSDEMALQLGGDVPFCQLGGRALVEGVGEKLTPLGFEERAVTLLLPSFSVNTRECYEAFDEQWANGAKSTDRNHLTQAARAVEPRLGVALDWLKGELGQEIVLAGSGSTMFVEGHLRQDEKSWDVQSPVGTMRFLQAVTTPR